MDNNQEALQDQIYQTDKILMNMEKKVHLSQEMHLGLISTAPNLAILRIIKLLYCFCVD
jgi:hypothetical protein